MAFLVSCSSFFDEDVFDRLELVFHIFYVFSLVANVSYPRESRELLPRDPRTSPELLSIGELIGVECPFHLIISLYSEEYEIWDIRSCKKKEIRILPERICHVTIADLLTLADQDDERIIRNVFCEFVSFFSRDHILILVRF